MPSIDELRARSADLFADLARGRAGAERATAGRERPFSWFNPDDAAEAVGLAALLAVVSGAAPTEDIGLQRALDLAAAQSAELPPELVTQAMAIFVTHHRPARQLAKPRTIRVEPELFMPSRPADAPEPEGAPDPERALDYWREDPFANEHHGHWHQVYPFPGLPVQDWLVWAETSDRAGLAALFRALDPAQDWPSFLAVATPQEIRDKFFQQAAAHSGEPHSGDWQRFLRALPSLAYRVLFQLNDRQGELFFYMHSQMLARYDAERLSLGMERVKPFSPDLFGKPIPEGYSPNLPHIPDVPDYTARAPDEALPQRDVDLLNGWQAALDTALANRELLRAVGPPRALDSNSLGEAVEAAQSQLTGVDPASYPGMHNRGHRMIAKLPNDTGNGVMNSPPVAIRDPIFWRWHRHIDNINTARQNTQSPYDFTDAPPVVLRDALSGTAVPWASPDVLLVSTAGLHDTSDPAALATAAVGGAAFDTAFAAGPLPGAEQLVVVDELTTRFLRSTLSNEQAVTHLTHDPFALIIRVRNVAARPTAITLRVFMAPGELADDRTMWMELDKLLVEVPAAGRSVVYRPDAEFSVVKKPAEIDPQTALDGASDPSDQNYCDCGWPYALLLPRGTPGGMAFRLAVFCTDGARDLVRPSAECGSMSFCGAVDRYPDTRDMGYPFSRPFGQPVAATILGLPAAAGRSLTIRHEP
jgi:hemocyanin-like protein